jgi:DNA-binding transcriptional ArsR family regulator
MSRSDRERVEGFRGVGGGCVRCGRVASASRVLVVVSTPHALSPNPHDAPHREDANTKPIRRRAEAMAVDSGDAEEPDPAELFSVVGNETRVEILRAFVERRRENCERARAGELEEMEAWEATLSFSELQEAVGIEDSGQFNYHLQQLLGRYVQEVEDGYMLTLNGTEIAGTILSGGYGGATMEEQELDADCTVCDADVVAGYRAGALVVHCEDDHFLMGQGLPTGAVEGKSLEELLTLTARLARHENELLVSGTCSYCYGPTTVEVGEAADWQDCEFGLQGFCKRCGMLFAGAVGTVLLGHPAVVAFYHDHGVDARERMPWELGFLRGAEQVERIGEDPDRFAVTVSADGDELVATVDGDGDVVDVSR